MISLAVVAAIFWLWWRVDGFGVGKDRPAKEPEIVPDLPEGTPYKVYTSEFDVEIDAGDYVHFLSQTAVPGSSWMNKLSKLRAGDGAHWRNAISKSEQLVAELEERWRPLERKLDLLAEQKEKAAITLLVDQSGSLRGKTIVHLAAALKWYSQRLEDRGFRFEILGFTTAFWRGGKSRQQWLSSGRSAYPGRLNDLLHIKYKSFERPLIAEHLNTMLHPQLIKENVDGEALMWAAKRLRQRREASKALIVVSDGAPVDDSTIFANGGLYLPRHFKSVRDDTVAGGQIALGGVGLGYDVDQYYPVSEGSDDLTTIPEMLTNITDQLIAKKPE